MPPYPTNGEEVKYDMDEVAQAIGSLMIGVIGTMGNLGLTTLQSYVKNVPVEVLDSPLERDIMRWLKFVAVSKKYEDREHLFPADLVSACQRVQSQRLGAYLKSILDNRNE